MIINGDCVNKIISRVDGFQPCKYCGDAANYIINTNTPCCSKTAKACPEYKSWFSQRIKNSYINNPELIEMRKILSKEVHSRPEVIEKKRNAMLHLHRESCDKCKLFQKNYTNGQIKRKEKMLELFHGTSKEALEFQKNHKAGVVKRSTTIHEKRHSDSDEAKEYRLKRTNKIRQKYIKKLNKYGILKINKYSSGKLKVMYQRLNYYISINKIVDITTYKICR